MLTVASHGPDETWTDAEELTIHPQLDPVIRSVDEILACAKISLGGPDGSGTCPAANGICNANAMPTVLVGGMPTPVAFAGQAPGFPGVFQVNITIPQNAPTGDGVSLVVKSADGVVSSNIATIAVQ